MRHYGLSFMRQKPHRITSPNETPADADADALLGDPQVRKLVTELGEDSRSGMLLAERWQREEDDGR